MINPITLKTISRSISLLGAVCILFFTSCTDEPPTCVISEPLDKAVYLKGETVTIEVDADDDDGTLFKKAGIDKVKFLIDEELVSTASTPPYSYSWNTANETLGLHIIVTIAEDNGGNSTQDEISVILNDIPSCDITSPINNYSAFQGSVVTISVDADDEIGKIENIEFYVDNGLIGTDDSSPFSYDWSTEAASAGNHTVEAVAVDLYGEEASDQINVQVQECLVCGTWEAEYTGYDSHTQANVTIKRTLIVNMNTAYNDTLYGKPDDQSEFIIYQWEKGNWRISDDGNIMNWTPTQAERINIDNGQLESYDAAAHDDQITLGEDNKAWHVQDDNLGVEYDLRKKQ